MSTSFGGSDTQHIGGKEKEMEKYEKCAGPDAFDKEVEKRMSKKLEGEQSGGVHIDIDSHNEDEDEVKKLAKKEFPLAKCESEIRTAIKQIANKYNARAEIHTSSQGDRVSIDGDIFFA